MRLPSSVRGSIALCAVAGGLAGIAAMAAGGSWPVKQNHRSFDPPTLDVAVGDTVRFSNEDEFIHHIYVHSPTFNFESDEQPPGQVVELKFTTAGTFTVSCQIHPKMHLAVTVK